METIPNSMITTEHTVASIGLLIKIEENIGLSASVHWGITAGLPVCGSLIFLLGLFFSYFYRFSRQHLSDTVNHYPLAVFEAALYQARIFYSFYD